MSLILRRAPRVVAAVASLIPLILSYDQMIARLAPDVSTFMNTFHMRMLIAYGVAFSAAGDVVSALVALVAVHSVLDDMSVEAVTNFVLRQQRKPEA